MLRKKELTAAEINAMPKSARPIGVEPLTPPEMAKKYADRVRRKKTERDKQNQYRSNKANGS
jgi:hypothetical protein